jgi:hypothetical protein
MPEPHASGKSVINFRLSRLGYKSGQTHIARETACIRHRCALAPPKAELVEGFTQDDRPGELDWGAPAGREAW